MEGRGEDLFSRVATANELMHEVVGLQVRLNGLSHQFAKTVECGDKGHPVLYTVVGLLAAFALVTGTPIKSLTYSLTLPVFSTGGMESQVAVWNAINVAVSVVVGLVFGKIIAVAAGRRRAGRIAAVERENARIEAENGNLARTIEEAKQQIVSMQRRWADEVASWYPMKYDNLDAVDYFLFLAYNNRAETVREMVGLYEEELGRRMGMGQRESTKQQAVGKYLRVGNLFVNGQIVHEARWDARNTAGAAADPDWYPPFIKER